jgi:hypothetical protein
MYASDSATGICIFKSVDILANYISLLINLLLLSNTQNALKGRDHGEATDIYLEDIIKNNTVGVFMDLD